MAALRLNRWLWPREGALLKPMTGGKAILPSRVRHARLVVWSMDRSPRRFGLTPLRFAAEEPPRLENPACPPGTLIDEVGQSTLREWDGKSRGVDEVVRRLRGDLARSAGRAGFGPHRSRWGGLADEEPLEASGFFRTHHDGTRWWLLDPGGHRFFSAGVDCVRVDGQAAIGGLERQCAWLPGREGEFSDGWGHEAGAETFSWQAANLRRAFGDSWRDDWAGTALGTLRRLGFNTVANWSEWAYARAASFPYVRPMSDFGATGHPLVFRDFPDVHHPGFAGAAAAWAEQLRATAGDPALIGYFLTNEPNWSFAAQTPAEGMLRNTEHAHDRDALARWLVDRHGRDGLPAAWGREDATPERIAAGRWDGELGAGATADLEAFSAVMVRRLWETLCAATRSADPDHLNLGVRFANVPPAWARPGLGSVDVISLNSYAQVPPPEAGELCRDLDRPALIGEFHFGAPDAGLPAAGLATVSTQADRGLAYRRFVGHAAASPWCVGCHWFTLYDQATLGRFDGEPYNCGLVDVCGRPYAELAAAAARTHAQLGPLCRGDDPPYEGRVGYAPRISV